MGTLHSLPELEQAGITGNDVSELYRKTVPCVYYKFRNKRVLVTHGGVSNLPDNLVFVVTERMIYGVREPEDAALVAESFNKTQAGTYIRSMDTGTLKISRLKTV